MVWAGIRIAAFLGCVVAGVLSAQSPYAKAATVDGKADAVVAVRIYEDLQCSDCATLHKMLKGGLLAKYSSRVAFVHYDFPLPKHAWAKQAAAMSRWLGQTDVAMAKRFRAFCLENLDAIQRAGFEAKVKEFAAANKLDAAKMWAAGTDAVYVGPVEANFEEGLARGISKTPTVIVGAEVLVETFTAEELAAAIDAALKGNE